MIAEAQRAYPQVSLRHLCALFDVSRAWYYGAQREASEDAEETALREAIEPIVLGFPGYGYRRMTKALQRDGWVVNHKRVLRIMRAESLLCHLKRHVVTTTDSGHGLRTYPNLLTAAVLDASDQAWVADITDIRLPTTFVYLACLLDAYSRRCIGWELSRCIDTHLTLAALEHALALRQPQAGLIHHSDRGVQYASAAYVERLQEHGIRISMAATGNPYENAKAESFFKTLKREEVYLKDYRTFAEVEANIHRFIEVVYNTKRLHSSLGYLPPVEFEATHVARGLGGLRADVTAD
jgi:putative transposase